MGDDVQGSHADELHSYLLDGFKDAIESIALHLQEAQSEAHGWDFDAATLSLDSIDMHVEELRSRIRAFSTPPDSPESSDRSTGAPSPSGS